MPERPGSLRGRLLGWLALLLAALMAVSAWTAYLNGRAVAGQAYDRTLLVSARAIAERLTVRNGRLEARVPYIALDAFTYDIAGRVYYQVIDPGGALVSGFESLPGPPDGTSMTDDYQALARFYDAHYLGYDVRVVSLLQPISENELEGMAEIRVAESDVARTRLARGLLEDTLLRLGVLAAGALLLVWLTVSASLRPLRRLSETVSEREPDDLRPLPVESLQSELRPLVRALNHFTERLRLQFQRQAKFVADAAHELRTPLAALKARLELGARETEIDSARASLRDATRSADQLIHLANQLLSLARIENGAQAIAEGGAQRLDLCQLARDVSLALAALAHKRGIALSLEAEGSVWLVGEPTLLAELLNNLLDNALVHTPSGGNVVVRVFEAGVLEVEDEGPGIPEEDREKVFARFYRRDGRGRGAGLGLAIVGEICRIHNAGIALEEGGEGGLKVRVNFNLAD